MKYTGTKTVEATPMTRMDYNIHQGWIMPADQDPADEGYLVEYLDGGKPNHPMHQGYISWSPKDVFERSYKPVEAPKYALPHQQRVYEEFMQNHERMQKLFAFKGTPLFESLPHIERVDLLTQYRTMDDLHEVLARRISRF